MTVVVTLKKQGVENGLRYKLYYVTVASGDTTITVTTGLKRILYHNITPPAIAAKYVTTATVSAGTITYTITDHVDNGYFYVKVISDI